MMIRHYKGDPNAHIVKYRNGRAVKAGIGISFLYMPTRSSILRVPVVTRDAQYAIRETTKDYQEVAVQGSVAYRIAEPEKAAALLDFSIDPKTRAYLSEDPQRIDDRIVNAVQTRARGIIRGKTLEQALEGAQELAEQVEARLHEEQALRDLGLVVEGFYVVSIQPTADMQKALEAEYREQVNRRADQAVYTRRQAALEDERSIRQTELNTDIEIENGRAELVAKQADNELTQARAEAEADELKLKAYAELPPQALVALALKEWAGKDNEIGQLNITPDMLTQLAAWMAAPRKTTVPAGPDDA